MPLTANRDVDHYVDQELRTLPVAAAKHVFKGALLGLSATGHVQPLIAGDPFIGVAYEEVDNSAGAAGAVNVRVYTLGDFGHALAGASVADLGRPVFASADNTLTFSGAGQSYVGIVQDVPSTGQIILRIDPARSKIKTITHFVEDLAAGGDIATRAIHAFDQNAWVVAARVVNQTTAAAGINDANTCVIDLTTGAGTVVSKTFNTANPFPGVNTATGMGIITGPRVSANSVLSLAVTNGATANPGTFYVQVDYV